MKRILLFSVVVSLIYFVYSCEKEAFANSYFDVEEYVNALKSNTYDSIYPPELSIDDIDVLLKHAGDKTKITVFPRNLISSLYQPECTLGIYLLWNIESIRKNAIEPVKHPLERFPSLNPILFHSNMLMSSIPNQDDAHGKALAAYKNWWNMCKTDIRNITKDPLKDADVRW